jgi:hypothetical protein
MRTEPRRSVSGAAEAEEVRTLAFSRYARRVTDVEDEIAQRWASDPFPEPERGVNEPAEE